MVKKRSIISYEKLSPELQKELKKVYPAGYADQVQKITTPKETLTVVPLETKDTIYLVKVKFVEKKSKSVDDDDDEFFDDEFTVPDTGGAFEKEKDEFGSDDDADDDYDKPEVDEDDEEAGDADAGDDDDED